MKNIALSFALFLIIVLGLITTGDVSGQSFVTDGLISFWTFDQATIKDDLLKDIWGKNDGTIKGKPQIVEGKVGEALSFDGVKDLVEVPINDELSRVDTDKLTVEAWLSAETPCYGVICGRDYWIFHWSKDKTLPTQMNFYDGVGGWKSTTSTSSVKDEWHHWAGVYDGKNLMVYMDGKKDASTPLSGKISPTGDGHSKYIVFGKDYHTDVNGDRWNKVIIDEVRIYNKALTDDEIEKNFMSDSNKLAIAPAGKLPVAWGSIKKQF